ncbi:MAG: YdcF family protein [Saprospiraceae bacterium]|nr:YdcF family protein [Saprospiraceae bacterium]
MFFILSKVLAFAIKPVVWIILLLGYSLFSKRPRRKRRALRVALLLLILFSNRWISNQIFRAWEPDTLTADAIETPYDIGIVLGGYSNFYIEPRHDRHNFNERGNRLANALELYFSGKVKKLLLSGGSGRLLQDGPSEAELMVAYLRKLGIPDADIILEPESRNTWENALFTKNIVDTRYPGATCLLITSAWHMRRSDACFRKAGLLATPFPVDYISESNRQYAEMLLLPDKLGLYKWELLIKEWIGCAAYRVRGYN